MNNRAFKLTALISLTVMAFSLFRALPVKAAGAADPNDAYVKQIMESEPDVISETEKVAIIDATPKLTLACNTYAYNKKGVRLKGKNNYFKKGKIVTSTEKFKRTNKVKRYYTQYASYVGPLRKGEVGYNQDFYLHNYWIPYKTIKKQEYYQIGKNKYIKCANVNYVTTDKRSMLDDFNKDLSLYTNEAVAKTKNLDDTFVNPLSEITNNDTLDPKLKIVKKKSIINKINNTTVTLDEQYLFENYHIKGTKYVVNSAGLDRNIRQTVSSHPEKFVHYDEDESKDFYIVY